MERKREKRRRVEEELNRFFLPRGDVKPGAQLQRIEETERAGNEQETQQDWGDLGKKERKEAGRQWLAKQAYFIDIVFMILTRVCSKP